VIRVAIVGAGVIGRNHAAAIARHPRLELVATVDPYVAADYATLGPALKDADLVAICTPSGLHADAVETALAAGRHVFVEKPVDASLPRARALASLAAQAEARGLVVSVVSQHRFDPASVAVARAVTEGRLGTVSSAVASVPWWREQSYYDSAAWRGTWALDGGGALLNQGVHTVDLLLWFMGTPDEVFAYTGRFAHERIEVEDVAAATVRFASGALAVLHATTAGRPGLGVRLALHGSGGSAVLHDDQLEYPAEWVPPAERFGAAKPEDFFVLGHLRQYEDVVDAIETGRPPGVRVDDAVRALATVRAVYVSGALGRPVSVPEVLAGGYDDVPVEVTS
jgi:UDP-N-acetyl-2-amino-2-deoxyglucuronate dehydrogenase